MPHFRFLFHPLLLLLVLALHSFSNVSLLSPHTHTFSLPPLHRQQAFTSGALTPAQSAEWMEDLLSSVDGAITSAAATHKQRVLAAVDAMMMERTDAARRIASRNADMGTHQVWPCTMHYAHA